MPSSPATIDASNNMKHPNMTVAAGLKSTRPVSAMNPMLATEMTAMLVAIVPSNVPSSQRTDATRTLEPGGSVSEEPYGQATVET